MKKVDEAIKILKELGLPREQQNERSGYTLLALLNIEEDSKWVNAKDNLHGVTPIMDWIFDNYKKKYQPNTRETIRRQTLHQFCDGGLCILNPDKPDRPVNSPKTCYQITKPTLKLIQSYSSKNWIKEKKNWLSINKTLIQTYKMQRNQKTIPIDIDENKIHLSPGDHSKLIKEIIDELGPRFIGNSKVLYIGDTGAKEDYFDEKYFEKLNINLDKKGKLPDVIFYHEKKKWLILVESVTSHGPIDGKRYGELSKLFKNNLYDLVFITAFPDKQTMTKFLPVISWETEVWISSDPTHMIHFNGDKFLGPYTNNNN